MQQPLEPHNRAIIASTMALGRSLEMDLVIEGVSSPGICDALIAMGCQTGQGYFLARPMTCQGI
ncbi:Phytochrome-like protein cph2 [compost metagenome]